MWWRSRGFGVHSPFAYSLIREVLAEDAPYYAYERLKEMDASDFRFNALLHRLMCRFTPHCVMLAGCGSATRFAVTAADSSVVLADEPGEARMVVLADDSVESFERLICGVRAVERCAVVEEARSLAKPELTVVVRHLDRPSMEARWRLLKGASACGMDFSDGLTGVLCIAPHLPRQSFTLRFA